MAIVMMIMVGHSFLASNQSIGNILKILHANFGLDETQNRYFILLYEGSNFILLMGHI